MMQSEISRLSTYTNWNVVSNVSPLTLAREGFYYQGKGDEVECFACQNRIDLLRTKSNLLQRHREMAPHCPLLNAGVAINVPLKINKTTPEIKGPRIGATESDSTIVESPHENITILSAFALSQMYRAALERAKKKGLFLSAADCRIDRSNPDFEKLRKEEYERLCTFYDWPSTAHADPVTLAKEGLFYTGTDDRVQCAFCRGTIHSWVPSDIPWQEHKKHCPDCPFVRGSVGDVAEESANHVASSHFSEPDNAKITVTHAEPGPRLVREACLPTMRTLELSEPPKYREFSDLTQRVKSFMRGRVSPGHTAERLADAGWFFVGPGDKVQCFQCGGNLKDWEINDDPWEEHKRWYGSCDYIRTHRPMASKARSDGLTASSAGSSNGAYRFEPREIKARMDTPTVRAILNMGYSRELVKTTIENRLAMTGNLQRKRLAGAITSRPW